LIATGVDSLVRDRRFAAVVLPDDSPFVPVAIRAGYRLADTVDRRAIGQPTLRVLVRQP
jgi:hypothetical protein